jgi:hypothetical protein
MALKTGIFSLALGALLLGSTAQADDTQIQLQWGSNDTQAESQGVHGGYGRGHYRPQPAPPRNQQGRYELKLVQQWVAGRYEQVWVPEQCSYKPYRRAQQCRPGYYDRRWVAGHYETVEQWVWVPSRWQRRSGPEWGTPASYQY